MNIKTENPAALHFIMQDELYFLGKDKELYAGKAQVEVTVTEEVVLDEVAKAVIAEPVTTPAPPVEEIKAPADIKYLGANKRAFAIVVYYLTEEFINQAHLTSLENILKRKGFELDDVAIVNLAKHADAGLAELINTLKPQKILFMGKSALPGGLAPLILNQLQQANGYTALYSYSFDEMMDSNEFKKAFWEQMKNL